MGLESTAQRRFPQTRRSGEQTGSLLLAAAEGGTGGESGVSSREDGGIFTTAKYIAKEDVCAGEGHSFQRAASRQLFASKASGEREEPPSVRTQRGSGRSHQEAKRGPGLARLRLEVSVHLRAWEGAGST